MHKALLTTSQIACMTSITRAGKADGQTDLANRKPYRTKALKALAREEAEKVKGTWRSPTKVLFHDGPALNGKGV